MIRPFKESDRDRVLSLCEEFWTASCADEYGEYEEGHTSNKLSEILSSGACFVTNDVSGFILLVESTNLCNPGKVAAEVAWYVTPNARGGDGIALLKTAIRYCELKEISSLSMMYMQSSMPESIVKIYDKMGLIKRETTYIKRLG